MHEYSLAKELITTLLEQVDEEKLQYTTEVHLEIGELKVVSKEGLSQAFKLVTEDTALDGAELKYEDVPLLARCEDCGFEGAVEYRDDFSLHFSVPVLSCPKCGGSVEVVKGDELAVRRLTVQEPDSDD